MSTRTDWVETRVREARQTARPAVTEAVATRMTSLLKGRASEVKLTPKELTNMANALVAEMAPPAARDRLGAT